MGVGIKIDRMEIARRIKLARKTAGLTQLEVAKRLQLTPQAISNYERGINKIPLSILFALAELYKTGKFTFLADIAQPKRAEDDCTDDASEYLSFACELNHQLQTLPKSSWCRFIQQKIEALHPNNVELFLAKKLRYGLNPDWSSVPSTITKEDVAYTRYILDSMRFLVCQQENKEWTENYLRLKQLAYLLQCYEKAAEGSLLTCRSPRGMDQFGAASIQSSTTVATDLDRL